MNSLVRACGLLASLAVFSPGNARADDPAKTPATASDVATLKADLASIKSAIGQLEQVDATKSRRLMALGLGIGTGLALHTPSVAVEGRRQTDVVLNGLTYLALHPGYWGYSALRNQFCANSWVGDPAETVQRDMASLARTRAVAVRDSLLREARLRQQAGSCLYSKLSDTGHLKECAEKLGARMPAPRPDADRMQLIARAVVDKIEHPDKKTSETTPPQHPDPKPVKPAEGAKNKRDEPAADKKDKPTADKKDEPTADKKEKPAAAAPEIPAEVDDDLLTAISHTLWIPGVPGRCASARIGMYLGVAFPYKAQIISDYGSADRSISAGFSTGLVFSPSAFLSLLLGTTVATFEETPDAAGSKNRHTLLTFTVGLGGNLDIITKLLHP